MSVTYTADGTQREFSFPFDYLRKAFVKVEINEETILVQGEDYSVSDSKTVVFTVAPELGTIVRVFRETPTQRLVSWADASVLRAKDMTVQQVQNLHILEEQQYWQNEYAIVRDGTEWNARNFPIKNTGYPVDPTDAANKQYVDDNALLKVSDGTAWEGRGLPIKRIDNPVEPFDAATKHYVDKQIEEAPDSVKERVFEYIDGLLEDSGDGTFQYDHYLDLMPTVHPVGSDKWDIDENGDIMPKAEVVI